MTTERDQTIDRATRARRREQRIAYRKALNAQAIINQFTPQVRQLQSQARNYTFLGIMLVLLGFVAVLIHPIACLLSFIGAIMAFRKAHNDRVTLRMAQDDLYEQQAIIDRYNYNREI